MIVAIFKYLFADIAKIVWTIVYHFPKAVLIHLPHLLYLGIRYVFLKYICRHKVYFAKPTKLGSAYNDYLTIVWEKDRTQISNWLKQQGIIHLWEYHYREKEDSFHTLQFASKQDLNTAVDYLKSFGDYDVKLYK